jgi:hypothetical protein
MCRYYAHTHPCGHTTTVFAAYCPPAQLIQTACPGGQGGEIWQSLRMEQPCTLCKPDVAEVKKGKKKVAVGGKR